MKICLVTLKTDPMLRDSPKHVYTTLIKDSCIRFLKIYKHHLQGDEEAVKIGLG